MTVLAIARTSLLRIGRDRMALFFIFVLPVIVIVIVGATVRGFSTLHVGVVDLGAGQSGRALSAALGRAPNLEVSRYPSVAALTKAVGRQQVSVGVELPDHMTQDEAGHRPVVVPLVAEEANTTQQAAVQAVSSVVAGRGGEVQAARFAVAQRAGDFAADLSRATALASQVPRVALRDVQAQTTQSTLPEGFSYSAPTELVLFVFLNALAAGAVIVETRRLGMYERMASAPVRPATIVGGETLTYVTLALCQTVVIVVVGTVAFGVSWGNPLAAAALLVVWALVGAGAGILSGTLFRTPEQASAVGPSVGIVLGMLGGCMWPLSIVSTTMRAIGHLTPHAWAVDAWTALLSRRGTVTTIAPQLGVLLAFAAGFMVLATVRLRRTLT